MPKNPRLRCKLAEKKTFEMQLANCESHSPSGALVGAQAPAGNHDEGVARLSIAVAANQSEQCMFSRNTFGALEPLDTFELALLPLSHLYISMPRAAGRKGPREPRNESGASTVAGPSRGPRAPAVPARRPRQPEDEDDDDEEEELLDHRRRHVAGHQQVLFALLAHDCRWTGFRERFRVAA